MSQLAFAVFALLLTACASDNSSKGREKAERIERRVSPGMTKGEVAQAIGEPVGNCRGNPETLETCEMQILTESARSFLAPTTPGDHARPGTAASVMSPSWSVTQGSAGYSVYRFVFENGRLKLWEKSFDRDQRDQPRQ